MAKLKDLIPDDRNFNKGSEFGNSLIEKSFRKFGAGRSILIDKHNRIIAGNKSVENAGAIGIEDVQIVESDGKRIIAVKRMDIDLDTPEGREMALADNASAKASIVFDAELIEAELSEAVAVEWGVEPSVKLEAHEDDYEIPEEIQTDIVPGDLFEIGEHRFLCGDSTDSEQVAKLMDGEKGDMLTDPPYGIDINMNMGRRKGQPEKFENKQWDKSIPDFFYLISMFENMIIWGGNYFADNLPISKNRLCWYKKTSGLDFGEFELAWTNCNINTRLISHHWSGETKLHPTMKPVIVMAWCLEYLKSKNIFDPFLGSGSTMVASHQLNRRCFGMELEPKYVQVSINRLLKLDPSLVIKRTEF